jgi:T5SS/PEP-CTERM-associated repeat protein/autotransporter-associated beta strand protein
MTCTRLRAGFAAALLALVTGTTPVRAQFTWNSPASGSWSVGSNWQGGTAPAPGATTALTFGTPATQSATYTATNDIGTTGTPFDLNALTVNNTAGTVTLAGNPLQFTGTTPTVAVAGAGGMVISPAATLAATTTVTGTGTGNVTFGGAVNGGTNNLVKTSAGSLTLAGGGTLNTLSLQAGATSVTGGTLALTAPSGTGDLNAGLQLGAASGQTAFFTTSGGARINVTENVNIGDAAGSAGTVTITGAGTVLDNTPAGTADRIRVGFNGTGTLNVTAGGGVNSVRLFVASGTGSTGDMVVDGVGSTVTSLMLRVGNQGTGTLTVRNGGTVNVTGTTFGQFPFIVGNIGVGTVTVRDSGAINTIWAFVGYGGDGPTGTGTLTVTGAGSTMTVGNTTNAGFLGVGMTELGTGTLNVQGGGLVTVNGDAHGAFFDGRGTFNVTDAGSLFRVTGRLTLGGTTTADPGTATLNVGSGGTVTVTGLASLQNASAINLNAGGVLSLGSLADGPRNGTGVVTLAAGTTLNLTDGGTTFSGVIGGAGSVNKTGSGVQTLAGANTYTGTTTVSAGTVTLTGSGSFAASPRITVGTAAGNSATLDVSGVTGGANFANGSFALANGQTLAGHGTVVGRVTITNGSAVAPGTGVGTLTVADMTWQGGGRYDFEFSGTTGDLINGTGALDLGGLNSANRFTINITSPGPSPTPQTFTVATFANGMTGFDPSGFAFSGFVVPGSASLTVQGNDLVLTFTPVPESAHVLLLCAAVAAVGWRRQRRRPALLL